MASGNQVIIAFAGEEKPLTDSFGRVGAAAKDMDTKVSESAEGFDRVGKSADSGLGKVGEAADNSERNLIGVHDVIDGTATIMQGPGKQGIVAYIQGWADLAGGLAPLILSLAETKVATLATAAAQKVAAVGAKVWAAGQWVLNAALSANPIGLVVIAIAALVAIFVLAWTHSETFRKIVIGAWNGIKAAAVAVGGWFKDTLWPWIKGVGDRIGDLFRRIPQLIKSAFSGLFNILTAPYRAAFNFIADAWNHTIGSLHWTIPGWVPGIGGNSISVPNLPHFGSGGIVPGVFGEPVPIMAHAGEEVRTSGGGRGDTVYVRGDGLVDAIIEAIAGEVRRRGGDPGILGLGGSGA